jgi:prepilin-type N-terminal cleavage/methylation domain-containing protein
MNRNNKAGFTLVELMIGVVAFCLCVTIIIAAAGVVVGNSDGKRVGTITKFSHKGLFVKSYEGELNMGGFRNRTDSEGKHSVVGNVWEFSCSNPEVANKLDNLLGKQVVIQYHQSFKGFKMDTSYDVVSVEEVK